MQLSRLRRTPASLAGNDLVGIAATGKMADQQRLQYPLLAHRLRECINALVIEAMARLVTARAQRIDPHHQGCRGRRSILLAKERREPPPETPSPGLLDHTLRRCSRRSTSPARCT